MTLSALWAAVSATFAVTGHDVFSDHAVNDSHAALANGIISFLIMLPAQALVMVTALIDLGERDASRPPKVYDVIALGLLNVAGSLSLLPFAVLLASGVFDSWPSSLRYFGGLGLFAVLVFLMVRLSLVFVHTLATERIDIGEAWRLTRGRRFGVLILSLAGLVLLTGVAGSLSRAGVTAVIGAVDPIEAPVETPEALLRLGPLIHLFTNAALASATTLYFAVGTCRLYNQCRQPESSAQPAS